MTPRIGRHRRARRLAAHALALVAALAALPAPALAREFSIERVDIEATLAPDGALSVRELREFDFDGSFNGVYWDIPTGRYGDRVIETTVTEVGEMVDGRLVAFQESSSGENRSYELSRQGSNIRVTVYAAHEDERAQVVIAYTDTDLAVRHDDVGELYWKFVSDGWDVESKDVSCRIHLPVPPGEALGGGDNVRAWGHGPLDASVAFDGDDVVYTVPGVGTSEFAEARVAFPASWLTEAAPASPGPALDAILSEEQAWADEANERRNTARLMLGGSVAAGVAASVLTLVVALLNRRRYLRLHTPAFDDEYFRDVPSADHPAVLGALWRGGEPAGADLTASLMRLTDQGVIRLEPARYVERGRLGREREHEDFRLVRTELPLEDGADRLAHDIDAKTLDFIFRGVAPHARHRHGQPDDGSFYFSELEDVAKHDPERYHDAYGSWQAKVRAAAIQREFYVDDRKVGKAGVYVVAGLGLAVSFLAGVLLLLMDAYLPGVAIMGLGTAAFAAALVIAGKSRPLSGEAIELRAQLDALRRWLKDFTRLGEAVPADVVLWNRLLVMATVLGVAKEVIDQLKVAAPQVLEDDCLAPVYGWYLYGGGRHRDDPASAFAAAAASAHHVSTAALASSSDSDGGGGGGGFSGGGGGGFGGGGGGGAF